MFKFNPHFEVYRIMVSMDDGKTKDSFFDWWYFTKRGAEREAEYLNNVCKLTLNETYSFSVERAILSNKVRERISQKAKA